MENKVKENLVLQICNFVWGKANINIPFSYREMALSDIQGDFYTSIKEKILSWDFKTPNICAILSNQNGIGKSHLAVSIIRLFLKSKIVERLEKFIEQNIGQTDSEIIDLINNSFDKVQYDYNVAFIPERVFLRELRDGYRDKNFKEEDFYKRFCKYEILVIDDIFSSKETDREFSRRSLLDLINDRFEYYNRPTVITSNLNINEIADIDTRLASRISNKMLIQINTKIKDHRI